MSNKEIMRRDVYIIDGSRTPFLKARGKPGPFSAADLAVATGKELLARQPFAPSDLGEVVVGCVMPRETEANIARIIALRLGCGNKVPGLTVQRNCGSGMQAVDSAAEDISLGRYNLALAGGTEAMSRAPLILPDAMAIWLSQWQQARGFLPRLKMLGKLRPGHFKPIISLIHGLTDPVVGLNMGQTAEILADRFHISREQMDAYALRSHKRLAAAQNADLSEVTPIYSSKGQLFELDDGVRADTSMEALANLKPFFDKKFGLVTAGNSSQITDGAALLILASEEAVKQYQLPVLGRIVDTAWAALAPEVMGLGPVYAAAELLKRNQLKLDDIDYWEINEAFAAQVLACAAAMASSEFCRKELGLDQPLGNLDMERLNVDGGAVAIGHPVGASGARVIIHLLEVLKRTGAKRGIASACIGGGQGGAMLLERV